MIPNKQPRDNPPILPLAPLLDIQVLRVHPVSGAGNLRAFVDVQIGPLCLMGCRVIQQPGQRAWVSLPQSRDDRTGRYYPTAKIEDLALDAAVKAAVLEVAIEAGAVTR